MAGFVLTDSTILVGGIDLSQFTGTFDLPASVNMVESRVHAAGGFLRKYPGIRTYGAKFSGAADFGAGAVSTYLTAAATGIGAQHVVTVAPQNASTAGNVAISTRTIVQQFTPFDGALGDLAGFTLNCESDTAEVSGLVAMPNTAYTSTVNGTVLAMTGPTAAQRLYAALHVTSVSGTTPSMTATVQSAALVGFGSPTTRGTFTAATATGSQWLTPVAGAITDGFWRVQFTISGTTPSFTACAVIGVL